MGTLLPRFDKQYQQRYVFNLNSAAGIMVMQRLRERGGVDELLTLLDRTRADLEAGHASREQIRRTLRSARRMAAVAADYLLRLVSGSTIDEMISERRHHEHPSLLADVRDLCALVSAELGELEAEAYLLGVEAQRYVGAREEFLGRLLDEGAQELSRRHHRQHRPPPPASFRWFSLRRRIVIPGVSRHEPAAAHGGSRLLRRSGGNAG